MTYYRTFNNCLSMSCVKQFVNVKCRALKAALFSVKSLSSKQNKYLFVIVKLSYECFESEFIA